MLCMLTMSLRLQLQCPIAIVSSREESHTPHVTPVNMFLATFGGEFGPW